MNGSTLVTSIGTGDYKEIYYTLDGAEVRSRFASVALARLLPSLKDGRALVLVTEKARDKCWNTLAAELQEAGLHPEALAVSEGHTRQEILEAFLSVADSILRDESVVLDVTSSLRHLPFVYLASLAYLSAQRGVKLEGVYYGAFELAAGGGAAPIIDMTVLMRLVDWHHALRSARERGDFHDAARMLRDDVRFLQETGVRDRNLSNLRKPLKELDEALCACLPLEAGIGAAQVMNILEAQPEMQDPRTKTSLLSIEPLQEIARPISAEGNPGTKMDVALSRTELERELRLAEWYAKMGDAPKALLVLREWIINVLLLSRGEESGWLDYKKRRKPMERLLNALAERCRLSLAGEAEKAIGRLWESLSNKRNRFAHAGMTPEPFSPDPDLASLFDECRAIMERKDLASLPARGEGRLLVTPLGLSPGVLYSAVLAARPDEAIVVTSAEGRGGLPGALAEAGAQGLECLVLELSDPHLGFLEAASLPLRDGVRSRLVRAAGTVVNVTGGTSAMQLAVDRIAGTAERLGGEVRRVALVDERPAEDQKMFPWVAGRMIDLTTDLEE